MQKKTTCQFNDHKCTIFIMLMRFTADFTEMVQLLRLP